MTVLTSVTTTAGVNLPGTGAPSWRHEALGEFLGPLGASERDADPTTTNGCPFSVRLDQRLTRLRA